MYSSFWLLAPKSRDLFQTEKEIAAGKVEQIHKITTSSLEMQFFTWNTVRPWNARFLENGNTCVAQNSSIDNSKARTWKTHAV